MKKKLCYTIHKEKAMVYREFHLYSGNCVDQTTPRFALRGGPYAANLPLSFNTTDASNNRIAFQQNGDTRMATIAAANYNGSSFPPALTAAMNQVSPVKDFSVSYDEVSRRLVITSGTEFTVLPFQQGTSMYRQLGMQKYSVGNTGTSVSFGVPDFTSAAPILLTSTTLTSKDLTFAGEENINTLAMIDLNAPQNSTVTWVNQGSWVYCGADISTVDFRLLNANTLIPIEMSQPFSVTLGILTDEDDVPL
jgi:hypothetical protein